MVIVLGAVGLQKRAFLKTVALQQIFRIAAAQAAWLEGSENRGAPTKVSNQGQAGVG